MRLAGKQSDGNLISCKKGSATRSHTVKCYIFVKKNKKQKQKKLPLGICWKQRWHFCNGCHEIVLHTHNIVESMLHTPPI